MSRRKHDDDHNCFKCGVWLMRDDGCEWPENKRDTLCGGCAQAELIRLRQLLKRTRARLRATEIIMRGLGPSQPRRGDR